MLRIDYCNCLLTGATRIQLDRLQTVINSATSLLFGSERFDSKQHATSDRLYWLPALNELVSLSHSCVDRQN